LVSAARHALHQYEVNTQGYKERNGHWSVLDVPEDMQVNAIHAALLRTGKVLLIAGSGNDREQFDAGKFETLLWDPKTDEFRKIHTPSDMFCAGHVFLPDGRLLIAGGTRRYEVLPEDIEGAAGVMTIKNEDPDGRALRLDAGTELVSPDGHAYRTRNAVVVEPASKRIAADGTATVSASQTEVWVKAVEKGKASVVKQATQFTISGVPAGRSHAVYGYSTYLTLEKQEYGGDDKSYLFDPVSERYEKVDDLDLARWYPTLVGLEDGRVLAVSGLDGFGRIIDGHNEIYDPETRQWTTHPELRRTFPTYPALFLMPNGKLFYTGSNAGYGSASVGRHPGIWDLSDNSFEKVPGLRVPHETETSGSVLLPPAQDQRYMVAGGGGIGESPKSTDRTDVIDLDRPDPRFRPGPDLAKPVRYPNLVITPDDKVVITGGSTGYRGEGASDLLLCHLYDPKADRMTRVADPSVGRDYHSSALLLPDGRVITLGSDPLYADADNSIPGSFEKRIEIYSPPYLYGGDRPSIDSGPDLVQRGGAATFGTSNPEAIEAARLIRPSAVTHVTDVEQRSIALDFTPIGDGIRVKIPSSAGLVPSGWYMLFVDNGEGAPSEARWVQVG
ncbi:MAG: radical copper oxidase GlxA, partial [Solirubrobacterales bacterium]